MASDYPSPEGSSNFDDHSPFNEGVMSPGVVRVTDRPIEAGLYPWGWVEYENYDGLKRPHGIQVVLLDDIYSRHSVKALHRDCDDRKFRSFFRKYRFMFLGIPLALIGSAMRLDGLVMLAFCLAMWTFVDSAMRTRRFNKLKYQIIGNEDLENYIRGREFLKALTHKHLDDTSPAGYAAYFNLNFATQDLVNMLKEVQTSEYSEYDEEED